MSNPKIIWFSTAVKLGGPMATRLPWYARLWRRYKARRARKTWNSVIFDGARRGRG